MAIFNWKTGKPIYIIETYNMDENSLCLYPCCFTDLNEARAYAIDSYHRERPKDHALMIWHDDPEAGIYIYGRAHDDYYKYNLVRVAELYLDPEEVEESESE